MRQGYLIFNIVFNKLVIRLQYILLMTYRSPVFAKPDRTEQRQYEALRAYFHEGLSMKDAAKRGGYSYGYFRNLCSQFRKQESSDFFWPKPTPPEVKATPSNPLPDRIVKLRRELQCSMYEIAHQLQGEGFKVSEAYVAKILRQTGHARLPRRTAEQRSPRALHPVKADRRALDLRPRTIQTDFAGLFLFAFDLARMPFATMLEEANMPGTRMIPAECAVLSLLALKLSGIGRPSQVMAETLDEGLALFTGLNVIPKRTTLTEYSISVDASFAAPLMHQWYHEVVNLAEVIGKGQSIDLDFHTIPYHGDQALLQKHFVSKRSRRQRGILTVLARDADARVFCYADANVRKETQNDAILRFVDDWKARTGQLPRELVFDSRFTVYANLAKLTELGIHFITLRRRHASLIRHIHMIDKAAWKKIRLSNIGRAYRTPSVVDEQVKLRAYPQPLRQLLVKNLGHDKPTVLITNQMRRAPAQLIDRYARRMIIENVISDAIDFFHMDALSAAVPMRINVDLQLTVMASTLYRLLGVRVGYDYEKAEARRIYRDLVNHSGIITITENEILVKLRKRANTGFLIKAGYPELRQNIPWLNNKTLRVQFLKRP